MILKPQVDFHSHKSGQERKEIQLEIELTVLAHSKMEIWATDGTSHNKPTFLLGLSVLFSVPTFAPVFIRLSISAF